MSDTLKMNLIRSVTVGMRFSGCSTIADLVAYLQKGCGFDNGLYRTGKTPV